MYDAIIIGAGVSGLTAAWKLKREGASTLVLEERSFSGGNIRTIERDGFRMEAGPNSFMGSSEYVWRLIEELNMEALTEEAAPVANNRYIYRNGRLLPLPLGPMQFLFTPLLSFKAKLRLMLEPFIPNGSKPLDTAWEFFVRRFGREAATYIMAPFVSGVYAGDIKMLGARAAFPKFHAFEREAGSMILGAIGYMRAKRKRLQREGKKIRRGLYSFKGGLGLLTKRLAKELGEALICDAPALKIMASGGGYTVKTAKGDFSARSIICAAPPDKAAPIIGGLSETAAKTLLQLPMSPVTLIHWNSDESGERIPKGFGFLMPRESGFRVLGTLFPSQLFSGRAPEGRTLLSSFYGGMLDKTALSLSDHEHKKLLASEHQKLFGLGENDIKPIEIIRYPSAIPQLLPEHPEKIASVKAELASSPGFFLAGNYLAGVGIEQAVESGYAAFESCRAFLAAQKPEAKELDER